MDVNEKATTQATSPPEVTIISPLYNAEKTALQLLNSLINQNPKNSVIFLIDDASKDSTFSLLQSEHQKLSPDDQKRVHLIRNHKNLGLAGTLNFGLNQVKTPFVLTCHCDILIPDPNYTEQMIKLMKSKPNAAAITGQPILPQDLQDRDHAPFAEKLNTVSNLMDVLLEEKSSELLSPIAFPEGRCDLFSMEALRSIGFYEKTLRTSGEDQVLAAKLRKQGYEIYKAHHLYYQLGVSSQQNSIYKIIQHSFLFGETLPYPLLKGLVIGEPINPKNLGKNRKIRSILRLSHLISVLLLILYWPLGIATSLVSKRILFHQHLKLYSWSLKEKIIFWSLQPILDLSYTLGFIKGCLTALPKLKESKP
jgi:GT2 family glycosyltransferase